MRKQWKNLLTVCLPAAFLVSFALGGLLLPDRALSLTERRPLAQAPEISGEALLDGTFMTEFEEYALDQFPLRDTFRAVKAVVSLGLLRQGDSNGVYAAEGYLSKLDYPLQEASLDYAADRFRYVYETYLKDTDSAVYLAVIPDKNYFLAEANDYPAMDYQALFDRVRERTEFAAYLDLTPLLECSDYYRTDTHWRQERIVDVADYLAGEMGTALEDAYETRTLDVPFYGVYAGQLALPLPGEELHYLTNPVIDSFRVYDVERQAQIPVYDLEKGMGQDPYELFLDGSRSLITIENPQAPTDRELILFRDSFGSSLAPLLAQGYAKVTLVDIRYLSPEMLGRFLTFDRQDVLFLYSTSVLNHSVTIK